MKKTIQITILILISNFVIGQEFRYIKPHLDDSCEVIKTVIDTTDMYEQLVYIDYKAHSVLKESLSNFKAYDTNKTQLIDSYNWILSKTKQATKSYKFNLQDKWIPLYKYNGKWILYNDIEFNKRYILTDTTLVTFDMDGLYSWPLTGYKFESGTHKFSYMTITWGDTQSASEYHLDIKLIDSSKGIYLWRFDYKEQIIYQLMIPSKYKDRFPVIGILTTDLMGDESEILDEINYETLTGVE